MSIDQVLDLQDQQEDCVADWADGGRQGAEQDLPALPADVLATGIQGRSTCRSPTSLHVMDETVFESKRNESSLFCEYFVNWNWQKFLPAELKEKKSLKKEVKTRSLEIYKFIMWKRASRSETEPIQDIFQSGLQKVQFREKRFVHSQKYL